MNIRKLLLAFCICTMALAAGTLTGCKAEAEIDPDGNAETAAPVPGVR